MKNVMTTICCLFRLSYKLFKSWLGVSSSYISINSLHQRAFEEDAKIHKECLRLILTLYIVVYAERNKDFFVYVYIL